MENKKREYKRDRNNLRFIRKYTVKYYFPTRLNFY